MLQILAPERLVSG